MNTTRMIRTLLFSLLAVVTAASWAQAATQTFEFKPPATDPDKRNGPGGLPGWSALRIMFSGQVSAAQFMIEGSPCPNFMNVPDFMGPTDTITIVPPPPVEGAPGYRIPVGKKFFVMVTSDNPVTVKPGAGSPPTPTFWRYKGNNSTTDNLPAMVVPEPTAAVLVGMALTMFAGGRRRRKLRA